MNFIVEGKDRKPNTQYIYIREEGNGDINIGTTSQENRYSTKTQPKSCTYIDVSGVLPNSPKDRPDDTFNDWIKKTHNWLNVGGHRDVYSSKYSVSEAIQLWYEYSSSVLNPKIK